MSSDGAPRAKEMVSAPEKASQDARRAASSHPRHDGVEGRAPPGLPAVTRRPSLRTARLVTSEAERWPPGGRPSATTARLQTEAASVRRPPRGEPQEAATPLSARPARAARRVRPARRCARAPARRLGAQAAVLRPKPDRKQAGAVRPRMTSGVVSPALTRTAARTRLPSGPRRSPPRRRPTSPARWSTRRLMHKVLAQGRIQGALGCQAHCHEDGGIDAAEARRPRRRQGPAASTITRRARGPGRRRLVQPPRRRLRRAGIGRAAG